MKARWTLTLVLTWLSCIQARRSLTRRHPTRGPQALASALFAAAPPLRRLQHASRTERFNIRRLPRSDGRRVMRTPMMSTGRVQGRGARDAKLPATSSGDLHSRRKLLVGSVLGALSTVLVPTVAEATYGSARGAVTSQPEIRNFDVEAFEKLDPRKQAQVQSILKPTQVDTLLKELTLQRELLQNRIEATMQSGQGRSEKLKEMESALKQLQRDLGDSGKALDEVLNMITAKKLRSEELQNKIESLKASNEQLDQTVKREKAVKLKQEVRDLTIQYEGESREIKKLVDKQTSLERSVIEKRTELEKMEQLVEAQRVLINVATQQEEAFKNAKEELDRNQKLQEQIKKREEVLAALDAQPDWFNYVAAFFASCISTLVMHPVDTLKTRQILESSSDASAPTETGNSTIEVSSIDPSNVSIIESTNHDEHSTTFDVQELASLYQGLPGALLKEGPPSALYLGIYEAVKSSLLTVPFFQANPLLAYLIAGGVGETGGSVIRAPAEQLKTRVQSGMDSSITESVQNVLLDKSGRENALRSWTASVWRDVPFGAIQLAVFESLKSYIINSPSAFLDIDVNALSSEIMLGAIGGAIGALVSAPMDVVTTRIMTQSGDQKLGFREMVDKLLAEGGWKALLKGARARTLYWAPAIGIFLSCYCSIRQAAVTESLF